MKPLNTDTTILKKTMYSKNITQAHLSRITGISYPQLSTYVNGVNMHIPAHPGQ